MKQAKSFFLICAGVLMLTVALKVGTEPAWADFDPNAPGPYVGVAANVALLDSGEAWVVRGWWDGQPLAWEREESMDSPVPVGQIKFYEGSFILTTSGELWAINWDESGMGGHWENMGTPPGAPVQGTSWSQLKSQFGR